MFEDRIHAGKLLAEKLVDVVNGKNSIVLAIPRGGVITGSEVSKKLNAELDIIVSKKITPPNSSEFAIGSIVHDGTTYLEPHWKIYSNNEQIAKEIEIKTKEVQRRLLQYRSSSNYSFDAKKTVIIVDDGMATGCTVQVILKWLSNYNIRDIILAVPVMPASTYEIFKKLIKRVIVLELPTFFSSVSQFYDKFDQVTDEKVIQVLHDSKV
ncbi:MAG: hypothetical protein JKX99_02440 [Robiginitomaculum sp.]|nr:hypothetical protein [Robiginitomaculum sp.]